MTTAPFSVRGQRVLVVGAARSGVAAALLLVRRGARVTLTDRQPAVADRATLEAAGVALELGSHRLDAFTGADLIVLSPGVPLELAEVVRAREAAVPVIGELELASRWVRGQIVAITGTKGKSTTTTLVGRMLEAAGRRVLVGGNIGVPLSAQVDASTDDTVHVVEASSLRLPIGFTRGLRRSSTSRPIIWIATQRWRPTRPPSSASSRTRLSRTGRW
jgi:UDP-N-acetylmuramoylalanine--D-glutamate ligase